MTSLNANNINIEYDTFGHKDAPALLLVMGLGAQMTAWDEHFCQQLADAGHFVIRYDNRDVGLSTHLVDEPATDLQSIMMKLLSGETIEVPYTLSDMAADGMALLTELGIEQAHICGASLGGMIVQNMAINHPERVLSLTSIMSTTGNPELPSSTPEAMAALSSERQDTAEHAQQRGVEVSKVIGSTGFPIDENRTRQKALESYERAYYPEGVSRQMAAIVADGDRRERLQQLRVPALIIHGDIDPLVPLTGGKDTHKHIPDAELHIVEGMGHDLPPGAWPQIIAGITRITGQAV